jgi:hypothetical protein
MWRPLYHAPNVVNGLDWENNDLEWSWFGFAKPAAQG